MTQSLTPEEIERLARPRPRAPPRGPGAPPGGFLVKQAGLGKCT